MGTPKKYLNAKDFEDVRWVRIPGSSHSPPSDSSLLGGFVAVSYLKNRESTGDLDFLIDPEFAGDKDIGGALQGAILDVANRLSYNENWVNDDMAIFVTKKTRQALFEQAVKQGVTLFKGQNLEVLAAPIEWALERKLRRIYAANRDRKAEGDSADAVAFLNVLRTRNNGPLDLESIRTMNMNGYDVVPDYKTMQRVADAYRQKYNEEIFR
ncbi:hypothetical protein N7497_000210 [Penicillium chrysogenum]|nr:hypothetical protein N7497_000210 [Penicillium chrysogenum]